MVNLKVSEINKIICSGNYPAIIEMDISQLNLWLKKKFGNSFKCKNTKEASILIKNISKWTQYHHYTIQTYIDSENWNGQVMDIFILQKQVLAKAFDRMPQRKKVHTLKKMLVEMLKLFYLSQQYSEKSIFERNKLRNFIASSKLEGIDLETNQNG